MFSFFFFSFFWDNILQQWPELWKEAGLSGQKSFKYVVCFIQKIKVFITSPLKPHTCSVKVWSVQLETKITHNSSRHTSLMPWTEVLNRYWTEEKAFWTLSLQTPHWVCGRAWLSGLWKLRLAFGRAQWKKIMLIHMRASLGLRWQSKHFWEWSHRYLM